MTDGILAIWNDCRAEDEAAYEAWYAQEHLPERLGIPGFRRGRRYEAVDATPRFFTYYETDTPAVLSSEAYIERVETPTPRTRAIMTGSFTNMSRTVCRVAQRHGTMRGAWAATLRLSGPPTGLALGTLIDTPDIARAELWVATETARDSAEARLRGGDATIDACVMVETLREPSARQVLDTLHRDLGGTPGLYRMLCELEAPVIPASGPAT
jgi:hypothetical protein